MAKKGDRGNKTSNETSPTTITTIHNDTHRHGDAPRHAITHYSFLWRGENKNTHERDREGGNNQLKNNTLIQQPVCMGASDKIKR